MERLPLNILVNICERIPPSKGQETEHVSNEICSITKKSLKQKIQVMVISRKFKEAALSSLRYQDRVLLNSEDWASCSCPNINHVVTFKDGMIYNENIALHEDIVKHLTGLKIVNFDRYMSEEINSKKLVTLLSGKNSLIECLHLPFLSVPVTFPRLKHFRGRFGNQEAFDSIFGGDTTTVTYIDLNISKEDEEWIRAAMARLPMGVGTVRLGLEEQYGDSVRLSDVVKSPAAKHTLIKLGIAFFDTFHMDGSEEDPFDEEQFVNQSNRLYPLRELSLVGDPEGDLVPIADYMTKCTDLESAYIIGDMTDQDDIVNAFNCFTRLKSVQFNDGGDKDRIMTKICEKSGHCIEQLEYRGGSISLDTLKGIARLTKLKSFEAAGEGIDETSMIEFLKIRREIQEKPHLMIKQWHLEKSDKLISAARDADAEFLPV